MQVKVLMWHLFSRKKG